MCLIAFAWGASERFPLVIAANRDEFFERPTAPLCLWPSPGGAQVLGGRDLQDGGTWMGFSPNGRFAMLTNVRNPQAAPPAQPISRGSLALAWLESDLDAPQWAKRLQPLRYQGFNLIVGDWARRQCHYLSNQAFFKPFGQIAGIEYAQSAIELIASELPMGTIYGLSNAALDTPWPKTLLLKTALSDSLASLDVQQMRQVCLEALMQSAKPQDTELPRTGVPIELERALASPFVRHPEHAPSYGTRTSLVAIYETDLGLRVTEVTHSLKTQPEQIFQAQLDWR
jgi:uncharacterized protein with NRDE domain